MASGPVPEEQSITCFPFKVTILVLFCFFFHFAMRDFTPYLRRLESLILNLADVINYMQKEATEISPLNLNKQPPTKWCDTQK